MILRFPKMCCLLNKMRWITIKFFIITTILLSVYLFLFYLLMETWYNPRTTPVLQKSVVLPHVVVHFDLKGSPPKLKYLESLLPMLKDHGANGLLIEYEDMFPYNGKLENISAKNCYDRAELKRFLNRAARTGYDVIPLIQTFGHLEHVLKLKEFRHLREVDKHPDSICPSNPESKILVKDMIEQVINFHSSIKPLKYIQIGCDEVFHINKCEKCRLKNTSNVNLYINYVEEIASIVKRLSPDTTVLIWDDMLRTIKPLEWENIDLFHHIEPVYWDYSPRLSVSHVNLMKYHKKFQNIWISSAYKGADGRTMTIPNFRNRFLNHFSWMTLILDYTFGGEKTAYRFKGIILTGWSRYSHMDPLCELLPASTPSLILNLLLISKFKDGIIADDEVNSDPDDFFNKYLEADINKSLQCDHIIDAVNFDSIGIIPCTFESTDLYNTLKRYILISADIDSGFDNVETGLSSVEYYSRVNTINMNTVLGTVAWCKDILQELTDVEKKLINSMSQYYDNDSIQEYVNYKIYNGKVKLVNAIKALNVYVKTRNWERNPVRSNVSVILN